MHGRLKVKTTAVQQEEKRRERQKKLKIFRVALSTAFKKISTNEYDDEGMSITKQILAANSDYTSMWNYRKSALKHLKSVRTSAECDVLWKNELAFVESCLRSNPKSYGCWHQRCCVLLHMDDPDWNKELHLTDLFLQLDDRNFHCWDYRRFLVKNSNRTADKELEFTNTLIENNFSNYSSWHYRSKLLPDVYPAFGDGKRVQDDKLIEELELVQNAFFTDPNDQSAWFYHRWLLGRGETKQGILSMIVKKSSFKLECTLRKPVKMDFFNDVVVSVGDKDQEGDWKALSSCRYGNTWVFTPSEKQHHTSLKATFKAKEFCCSHRVGPMEHESVFLSEVTSQWFCDAASDAALLCVEDELQSCRELNELEPGNKWVLLTMVLLMKASNPIKYLPDMMKHLSDLCKIDKKRAAYYHDLQSRYQIENHIVSCDFKQREVHLAKKNLTRLCHTEFFTTITVLDISDNNFTELGQPFAMLHSLLVLQASKNQIKSVHGLRDLSVLQDLDLSSNNISSQEILHVLSSCKSLNFVSLLDNPLKYVVINDQSKSYTCGTDLPFEEDETVLC